MKWMMAEFHLAASVSVVLVLFTTAHFHMAYWDVWILFCPLLCKKKEKKES